MDQVDPFGRQPGNPMVPAPLPQPMPLQDPRSHLDAAATIDGIDGDNQSPAFSIIELLRHTIDINEVVRPVATNSVGLQFRLDVLQLQLPCSLVRNSSPWTIVFQLVTISNSCLFYVRRCPPMAWIGSVGLVATLSGRTT